MSQLPDCQVLRLPYKGGSNEFVVILPSRKDGLPELEKSLSPERLAEFTGNGWPQDGEVVVTLPKFEMETSCSLQEALTYMGLQTLFTGQADLRGIAAGSESMRINEALHKTYLRVDETGTEAAAVTLFDMELGAAEDEPPIHYFTADHPFLFLIRDRQSRQLLFMGRYLKPGKVPAPVAQQADPLTAPLQPMPVLEPYQGPQRLKVWRVNQNVKVQQK